jgi:hypothetical protein
MIALGELLKLFICFIEDKAAICANHFLLSQIDLIRIDGKLILLFDIKMVGLI